MVRTKVLAVERHQYRRLMGYVAKRWDVSGLQNGLVDDNGNETY